MRETAAWALGHAGDRTAVDILGDAVKTDKSARVRGTAAWALGQLDPKEAPRGLIDALADDDDDVRLKSAWALGQIGDSSAVSAIRSALRVGEERSRAEGADSSAAAVGRTVGGDADGSAAVERSGGARGGGAWARGKQLVQSVALAVAAADVPRRSMEIGNRESGIGK